MDKEKKIQEISSLEQSAIQNVTFLRERIATLADEKYCFSLMTNGMTDVTQVGCQKSENAKKYQRKFNFAV